MEIKHWYKYYKCVWSGDETYIYLKRSDSYIIIKNKIKNEKTPS